MSAKQKGEEAFKRLDKINAELFTLTYGSIVMQLIKDFDTVEEVNEQLDEMGYNIGVRLVEEFLAKSGTQCNRNLRDAAETIAKVGFKMFLGVSAQVPPGSWSADGNEFSLVLEDNPLTEFVELPEEYSALWYSNILCGVIRGALEMVQMDVECKQTRCTLKGDDATELRVFFKGMIKDEAPAF
ncbi:Trafficking protein particle complex subunit 3 [Balamuthia mandrillaris]